MYPDNALADKTHAHHTYIGRALEALAATLSILKQGSGSLGEAADQAECGGEHGASGEAETEA